MIVSYPPAPPAQRPEERGRPQKQTFNPCYPFRKERRNFEKVNDSGKKRRKE